LVSLPSSEFASLITRDALTRALPAALELIETVTVETHLFHDAVEKQLYEKYPGHYVPIK